MADRKFQILHILAAAHDREFPAVARDISVTNILQDRPGRPSRKRRFAQSADGHPLQKVVTPQRDGHRSVLSNTRDIGRRQIHAAPGAAVKACRENFAGAPVEGSTEYDTLPIGCEACGTYVPAAKDQLPE